MDISGLRVTVVGGAVGGAAAALLLGRAGARVTLLERVTCPAAVGAGLALADNGLAVLESLGLLPAIAAASRPAGHGRVVDAGGRTIIAPPARPPRVLMMRRSDLHRLLLDAVCSEPRISCAFGSEAVAAWPDGRLAVRTRLSTATSEADLVVGADGAGSRIREDGSFGARVAAGRTYVRGLVDAPAHCEEAWTSAGLFGSFDVPGGTYVYASGDAAECAAAIEAEDLDAFRAAWARAYPPSSALLAGLRSFSDLLVNRVVRVDCRRWFHGRLVLVGDAAHAMAPNLGQGANSALVDAAVLLDELRRAQDVPAALQAYDARRRPAVRRVAGAAEHLGWLAGLRSPVACWLRNRALRALTAGANGTMPASILQEPPATLLAIGRA